MASHVLPNIYLGSCKDAKDLKTLKSFGVTHVLSLWMEDAPFPLDFEYLILDLNDRVSTRLDTVLPQALEFAERGCGPGKVLFLYCGAGISRAPSVLMAFFIVKRKMAFEQAFRIVKVARPVVDPNAGFVKQLKELGNDRLSDEERS